MTLPSLLLVPDAWHRPDPRQVVPILVFGGVPAIMCATMSGC